MRTAACAGRLLLLLSRNRKTPWLKARPCRAKTSRTTLFLFHFQNSSAPKRGAPSMCDVSLPLVMNQPSLTDIDQQSPVVRDFTSQHDPHFSSVPQWVAAQAVAAPNAIAVTH